MSSNPVLGELNVSKSVFDNNFIRRVIFFKLFLYILYLRLCIYVILPCVIESEIKIYNVIIVNAFYNFLL